MVIGYGYLSGLTKKQLINQLKIHCDRVYFLPCL